MYYALWGSVGVLVSSQYAHYNKVHNITAPTESRIKQAASASAVKWMARAPIMEPNADLIFELTVCD